MDRNNTNNNVDKDINIFSSIKCNDRNNYDKKFCEGLNNNKINNFLKPYINSGFEKDSYFEKNKYFLETEDSVLNNISKEECSTNCIENNYEGFKYEGDKNKCILFSSADTNNKIGNTFGDYSVKTFLKSRNTIDIDNIEDQLYSKNYFTEYNNYEHMPNDLIKELNVESEEECMDYCLKNSDKCKSILYAEQPKKCSFYKKKTIKNTKTLDSNYDIYTVKKNKVNENIDLINTLKNDYIKNEVNNNDYYYCNLNNDKCILDYKLKNESIQNIREKDENIIKKPILYDCSGFYSTNPFCTKEYDPSKDDLDINDGFDYYSDCFDKGIEGGKLDKFKKIYNKNCKKKFGNEYVFDDNIYDLKNIVKCDNNMEKVKCKINFNSDNLILEKFENNNDNNFSNYILLFIILFIVINFLILCFT
jgi:hypothetical protein